MESSRLGSVASGSAVVLKGTKATDQAGSRTWQIMYQSCQTTLGLKAWRGYGGQLRLGTLWHGWSLYSEDGETISDGTAQVQWTPWEFAGHRTTTTAVTGVEYSLALEFVCGCRRQSWRGADQAFQSPEDHVWVPDVRHWAAELESTLLRLRFTKYSYFISISFPFRIRMHVTCVSFEQKSIVRTLGILRRS